MEAPNFLSNLQNRYFNWKMLEKLVCPKLWPLCKASGAAYRPEDFIGKWRRPWKLAFGTDFGWQRLTLIQFAHPSSKYTGSKVSTQNFLMSHCIGKTLLILKVNWATEKNSSPAWGNFGQILFTLKWAIMWILFQ